MSRVIPVVVIGLLALMVARHSDAFRRHLSPDELEDGRGI